MFRSNFDYFSRPGYHRSTQRWKSGPDLVLHPKHIDTIWGAILSFLVVRSKNVLVEFWRLFGSGYHRSRKVEKKAQITRFSAQNIPIPFGVQFLSFSISTTKHCFGPILMTFSGPGSTGTGPEQAKLITGSEWPGFAPETYPHCLGCRCYRLSSVLLRTVLVEILRLFGSGHHRSRKSSKQGIDNSV